MSLLVERIFKELGASTPVYAVLDCARDSRVAPWALASKAPVWNLYEGTMAKDLEEVAPRLIRLGRGHAFTEEFFQEGFRDNWGIVFASEAPSKDLRRHLRKFFLARTEDNRRLLFRYYDPRVLSIYLPAINADELKIFFGPITSFVTSEGAALEFKTWRRRGVELVEKKVVIEPPPVEEPAPSKQAG